MAIRDTSRKPFIEDNDTKVKIGIDLPIRRGDDLDGFFATTSTTIEAVKNNIRNLLQTEEGERFFQPNLGIGLRKLLFEHITVLSNENTSDIGLNEIRIKIDFNIKRDPNTLDSITLDFSSTDISETESTSIGTGGGY